MLTNRSWPLTSKLLQRPVFTFPADALRAMRPAQKRQARLPYGPKASKVATPQELAPARALLSGRRLMMDPAPAANQLALAHKRMTPAEIAEHAVCLAGVIESQDGVVAQLLDHIAKLESAVEVSDRTRINAQTCLRQAASLFASGQKKAAARDFLREAAAVEIVRTARPTLDRSLFKRSDEAWPDIFNPDGSK